jgi:hypothetical protein
MADKEPRHRFLIRDRFALAYARSLPLCFFFRQVETSFEPAVIELERHAEPASCLFRQHPRADYFVHFQRHFATRALTPTDVNLLQQSEGGRGGTLTINSCAEAFIRIRARSQDVPGTIKASALFPHSVQQSAWSSTMSRGRIFGLSVVAAIVLSSAALAQGGGGGGGAGGGSSGAGGASGAAGTTSGSRSGPSGNSVGQPPSGQSSPTGNTAAQPPGSTGQNSINSPGTGVGPGSTGSGR